MSDLRTAPQRSPKYFMKQLDDDLISSVWADLFLFSFTIFLREGKNDMVRDLLSLLQGQDFLCLPIVFFQVSGMYLIGSSKGGNIPVTILYSSVVF